MRGSGVRFSPSAPLSSHPLLSSPMRRIKRFLHNAKEISAEIRDLLWEFHGLVGVLMVIALALMEFFHLISVAAHR